jgi:peptidylprolyl isomerase
MSNRVQGGQRAGAAKSGEPAKRADSTAGKGSTEEVQLTKPEKRALAKKAAAKRAAAERRKRLGMYWTSGVVTLGVIVAIFVGCVKSQSTNSTTSGASASASAGATVDAKFPPLPEGADPALGTKPTVTAGTGDLTELKVTTLIEGKGAAVTSGQHVVVNYVGVSFKTGQEFDSSWKRSQAFDFDLGTGKVIKGWDQGLVGVKIGSRVQLDIPSNLAYGDSGNPAGPLRFVVDVLGVS